MQVTQNGRVVLEQNHNLTRCTTHNNPTGVKDKKLVINFYKCQYTSNINGILTFDLFEFIDGQKK